MSTNEYLEQLRQALARARMHHSMAAIAREIGISNPVLTAFSRNRGLGPSTRAALEGWLRNYGYWPPTVPAGVCLPSSGRELGVKAANTVSAVQPAAIETNDLPVSELVARWHETQIAMLRSHHLTENQKKRLEGQWLKAYAQAWTELEKSD